MHDCSGDVLAYHDDHVTLSQTERSEMRERRDANRTRLKKGLANAEKPAPDDFKSQGSYAMKTMVQHPDKKYDLDDGVYFRSEDLKGERGADLSALQARQRVRDALDDGSFTKAPEVRENCVRVYYNAGYHVDVPVYRRIVAKNFFGQEVVHYELAGADWKRSDACDVTAWFEKENNDQSPDTKNGRQLRRITRLIKKLAKSRPSWEGKILSGFGITKLVTECYKKDKDREDKALYDTMKAILNRLNWNLVVEHPCTAGATITKDSNDAKARFLRDKLSDAIERLKPLFDDKCTRKEALKAWGKVFATECFSERSESRSEGAAIGSPAVHIREKLKKAASETEAREAVRKEGGNRYA